jgi:hypothetical protein
MIADGPPSQNSSLTTQWRLELHRPEHAQLCQLIQRYSTDVATLHALPDEEHWLHVVCF